MKTSKLDVASFKEIAATASSVMSVIAIVVGGYWTYLLAIKERKFEPRANIEHKSEHVVLDSSMNLLRVVVKITNAGDAELITQDSKVAILRLVPLTLVRNGEGEGKDIVLELQKQADGVDTQREYEAFHWPLVAEFCTKREEPQKAYSHLGINHSRQSGRPKASQTTLSDQANQATPGTHSPPVQVKDGEPIEPILTDSTQKSCKPSKDGESITIRPKEYAELSYEFAIDSRIQVINIYTFYTNQNQPSLGWELTTLYDFRVNQKLPDPLPGKLAARDSVQLQPSVGLVEPIDATLPRAR
jgi:hypothetical protein